MAALDDQSFNLTGAGEPERFDGKRVNANLFELLGAAPRHGRAFAAEEDRPGTHKVVILTHALWQRRFGSDAGIVGRTLTLNGEAHTVDGVMTVDFQFPDRDDPSRRNSKERCGQNPGSDVKHLPQVQPSIAKGGIAMKVKSNVRAGADDPIIVKGG